MRHTTIQVGPELRHAIESAEDAVQVLRESGQTENAAALEEYIQKVRNLRFTIGIVGQTKRGKSTLINAFLGRTDDILAPIDSFPATNVVSCFGYNEEESARVLFQNAAVNDSGRRISYDQIKDYACEDNNPKDHRAIYFTNMKYLPC